MKVVPITLKQANAFVIQNHRHHSKVQGCKFCIGAVDDNGELRGVAITGRPVIETLAAFFMLPVFVLQRKWDIRK